MGRGVKLGISIIVRRTRFDTVDTTKAIGTRTLAVERVALSVLTAGEGG